MQHILKRKTKCYRLTQSSLDSRVTKLLAPQEEIEGIKHPQLTTFPTSKISQEKIPRNCIEIRKLLATPFSHSVLVCSHFFFFSFLGKDLYITETILWVPTEEKSKREEKDGI